MRLLRLVASDALVGARARAALRERSRNGRRRAPARPAARAHGRDACAAAADRLGAHARRLPDDEPLRRHAPARAPAPAPAAGDALEPRAARPSPRTPGLDRGLRGRAAASGDGEGRRLHARRGRVRAGEPDRAAAGVRALPRDRARRALAPCARPLRARRPQPERPRLRARDSRPACPPGRRRGRRPRRAPRGAPLRAPLRLQGGALLPWVEVARRVEGVEGSVRMRWSVEPRFDWGRGETQIRLRRGTPVAESGNGDALVAIHAWDAGEPKVADSNVGAAFETSPGSRSLVALTALETGPIPFPRREDVDARIDATCGAWRRWLDGSTYDGPWRDAVARSALALRLLVHTPEGAIAAAPTTSLPERIGGDRNYDYRYAWVRDSAFTLDALIAVGLREQVHESFAWLLRAVGETEPEIRPFYALDGTIPTRLDELPLRGYRDSRPVRYGNAAGRQLQLGSWGDLLETADLYIRDGNAFDDETGSRIAATIDRLCVIWRDEDSGIWELPDLRHYTISKLASWTAFDRALRLVEEGQLPNDHVDRWREEREAVRELVQARRFSEVNGQST